MPTAKPRKSPEPAISAEPSSKLFKLTLVCAHCGTRHLEQPGEYGDCRKCGETLPGMKPQQKRARGA